jgi:hypothetical protein
MTRSTPKLSLAIATIATLGTFALAPTGASAMGFGGHGFGGGHSFGGGGGRSFGGGFGGGRSFGGGHFAMMTRGSGWGHGPQHWPHPHWHPHWHYAWGGPYYGGTTTAVYSTPSYSTPSYTTRTDSCTCLTKEYLPDNSVLFKDVCTKESALSPVNNDQGNAPGPQGYQSGPQGYQPGPQGSYQPGPPQNQMR